VNEADVDQLDQPGANIITLTIFSPEFVLA
jgi:hypothetical protein